MSYLSRRSQGPFYQPSPKRPAKPRSSQPFSFDQMAGSPQQLGQEPREPERPEVIGRFRIAGLDLGQTNDYTAIAGIERRKYHPDHQGPKDRDLWLWELNRTRGEDYVAIVDAVLKMRIDMLIVDMTGVGRPVVDMLRQRAQQLEWRGRIVPVVIAASSATMQMHHEARGNYITVPKVDLVTSINVCRQERGLVIPDKGHGHALLQEMAAFQMRRTKKGNEQFSAREGAHDDLVLALGLACWWAQRFGRRELSIWAGEPRNDHGTWTPSQLGLGD